MTLPALQQSPATVTLPTFRDILIRRRIEAPRRLVWEVLTRPEHLARWLGAPRDAIVRCHVDLRAGGRFDLAWRRGSGGGITMLCGTYHDVVAEHRLVLTTTERCTNTLHAIMLDDVAHSTRLVLRTLSSSDTSVDAERLTRLERYLRAMA
jgi:uncharacterized protein YndB with AHSA1/START domain